MKNHFLNQSTSVPLPKQVKVAFWGICISGATLITCFFLPGDFSVGVAFVTIFFLCRMLVLSAKCFWKDGADWKKRDFWSGIVCFIPAIASVIFLEFQVYDYPYDPWILAIKEKEAIIYSVGLTVIIFLTAPWEKIEWKTETE